MKVGVLALQGAFQKHASLLKELSIEAVLVKSEKDLKGCRGLILPGGESTVMRKLLFKHGLWNGIQDFAKNYPLFGTCAGLILMSSKIKGETTETLSLLDIEVERNAFGSQRNSFIAEIKLPFLGEDVKVPAFFIRAPQIIKKTPLVKTLSQFLDHPILVEQRMNGVTHLGASFHPELTSSLEIHRYFIKKL